MIDGSYRLARSAAALVVLAGAALVTVAAHAQAPLACSAANSGQQVCQAQNVCRCTYNAGGTMIREPPGYRWDCSSLTYGTCPPGSPYTPLAMAVAPPAGAPYAAAAGAGDEVRAAQIRLARLGFNPGPADGVIGPRTAGAIRAFQRAQRLPETGSLTPETLSRLHAG